MFFLSGTCWTGAVGADGSTQAVETRPDSFYAFPNWSVSERSAAKLRIGFHENISGFIEFEADRSPLPALGKPWYALP